MTDLMDTDGWAPGELEQAIKQRVKDGFGYFLVSIFFDSEDIEKVYGRMVAVKARDAAHAREIPLNPGEVIDGVDVESQEMYDWNAKGDNAVDLMASAESKG